MQLAFAFVILAGDLQRRPQLIKVDGLQIGIVQGADIVLVRRVRLVSAIDGLHFPVLAGSGFFFVLGGRVAIADGLQPTQLVAIAQFAQLIVQRRNGGQDALCQVRTILRANPAGRGDEAVHLHQQARHGELGLHLHFEVVAGGVDDIGAQGVQAVAFQRPVVEKVLHQRMQSIVGVASPLETFD